MTRTYTTRRGVKYVVEEFEPGRYNVDTELPSGMPGPGRNNVIAKSHADAYHRVKADFEVFDPSLGSFAGGVRPGPKGAHGVYYILPASPRDMPFVKALPVGDFQSFYREIGTHSIERVYVGREKLVVIMDEEGAIRRNPKQNPWVGPPLYGTLIIASEPFNGLTPAQIKFVEQHIIRWPRPSGETLHGLAGRRGGLTVSDIEQWIDNDEGLYNWWKTVGGKKRDFIKKYRAELEEAIENVTSGRKRQHYLEYDKPPKPRGGWNGLGGDVTALWRCPRGHTFAKPVDGNYCPKCDMFSTRVDAMLVYEDNGEPVKEGDTIMSRGETLTVTGWRKPHKPGSTGRVIVSVQRPGDAQPYGAEYYPNVIGAKWTNLEGLGRLGADLPGKPRMLSLKDLLPEDVLDNIERRAASGRLTVKELKDICHAHATHLDAKGVDPTYLAYMLAHLLGVRL